MIKGILEKPDGSKVLLFGLSFRNLDELRKGNPIHLDRQQCGELGFEGHELLIIAGETEQSMADDLSKRVDIQHCRDERPLCRCDEPDPVEMSIGSDTRRGCKACGLPMAQR